jgi:hypothetical protein
VEANTIAVVVVRELWFALLPGSLHCISPEVAHHVDRTIWPGPLLVEPDMAELRLLILDLQNGKVVSTSAKTFTMPSANVTSRGGMAWRLTAASIAGRGRPLSTIRPK